VSNSFGFQKWRNKLIDFKEISSDGETWELFARDFLEEMGFFIETPPDRVADGDKDMLITEEVKGKLHRDKFRWLVSCKHHAHSDKAVNENDHEKNMKTPAFRNPSPDPALSKPENDPTINKNPAKNILQKLKGEKRQTNTVEIYTTNW
jgi:hypothetical protein